MITAINAAFDLLAVGFDKIPFLNKIKGYRTAIGFAVMAIMAILKYKGFIEVEAYSHVQDSLAIFSGLALNAKGRSV